MGDVAYSVLQLRDVDAAPIAAIREQLEGRTDALKHLVVEMCARGCSTPACLPPPQSALNR